MRYYLCYKKFINRKESTCWIQTRYKSLNIAMNMVLQKLEKQLELSLCIEVMHGVFPHHVKRCETVHESRKQINGRHFEWSE